jgi:hypothetical protein
LVDLLGLPLNSAQLQVENYNVVENFCRDCSFSSLFPLTSMKAVKAAAGAEYENRIDSFCGIRWLGARGSGVQSGRTDRESKSAVRGGSLTCPRGACESSGLAIVYAHWR